MWFFPSSGFFPCVQKLNSTVACIHTSQLEKQQGNGMESSLRLDGNLYYAHPVSSIILELGTDSTKRLDCFVLTVHTVALLSP
jgi:hypothetical protein